MYEKTKRAINGSFAFVPESLKIAAPFEGTSIIQIMAYRHIIHKDSHATCFGYAVVYEYPFLFESIGKPLSKLTYQESLDTISFNPMRWNTLHKLNEESFKTMPLARKKPELNEDYDPTLLSQMRADRTFIPEHLDGWYKKATTLSEIEQKFLDYRHPE